MKKKLIRKSLAVLLTLAMVMGVLPDIGGDLTTVYAAGEIMYIDENGVEQTLTESYTSVTDQTTWNAGWYVVDSNVTISSDIKFSEDVHLILKDGCKLTVNGGVLGNTGEGDSLTIYGQSGQSGELNVTANNSVGIGGQGTTITINSGRVIASSSAWYCCGIGVSTTTSKVSVIINGGYVDAYAGDFGIGGPVCSILITGGTVVAKNSTLNPAIGGASGNITMTGGNVTAKGGWSDVGGANATVTIDGNVNLKGKEENPRFGGDEYNGCTVNLSPISVILNPKELSIQKGEIKTLIATVAPAWMKGQIQWETSNEASAFSYGDGRIGGGAPGEATITATVGNMSESCIVTVKNAGPAAPSVTGDYAVSSTDSSKFVYTVTPVTGAEYKMDNGTWQDSNVFDGIVPESTHTFYARIKETEDTYVGAEGNSGAVQFSKLANSNVPALDVSLSGKHGNRTVTIDPVSGAEYSFDGGVSYGTSNVKDNVSGTINVAIRFAETDTLNPSSPVTQEVNTDKIPQTSFAIDTIGTKTYGDEVFTLSVSGKDGTGSVTYESSDADILSISGDTATIHKAGSVAITAKIEEDDTYQEATATFTLTINRADQSKPAAPTIESHTENSVTLATIQTNANGAAVEYSKDDGASWQSSPEITGLSGGVEYIFAARYAEVEGKYNASDSAVLKSFIPHTMTHHEAVEATCIAEGNVEYWTCSECNKNYDTATGGNVLDNVTTAIKPDNHINTTAHEKQEATCLDKGYEAGTYCDDCKKWISGHTEIPAAGHSFTNDCDTDCNNANCDFTRTVAHQPNEDDGDCTTAVTCEICNEITTAARDSHDFTVEIVDAKYLKSEATCTTKAVYCKSCSICGTSSKGIDDTATFTSGDLLPHTMTHHEAVDATCSAKGNIEYWSCSSCDKNYDTATGGNVLDNVTTAITPDNHVNTTPHEKQEATCLDIGYEAGTYCDDCKKWISGHTEIPATGHNFTNDCDTDCDNAGCTYKREAPHNIIHHEAKEPTYTEVGWKAYDECKDCDYTTYVEFPKLVVDVEYKITEGANQTIKENYDGTVTITCDGELSKFVSVSVDGNKVDGKNYTLKSGSTILTFTKEYVDSLAVGIHTVRFEYTDGFVETNLTIAKAEVTDDNQDNDKDDTDKTESITEEKPAESAKTGDSTPLGLLIVFFITSLAGFSLLEVLRRKRESIEK